MNNRLVYYPIFELHENTVAFSTTKKTFQHTVPRFTGDSPEIYTKNREQLAGILGIQSAQLVFPRQTHTNNVVEIPDFPENEIKETDALVTNHPGICLCIQTADCVPILLFDPVEKVISAVHAGWRGTVKKITEIAVLKMISNYGTSPENILAVVGPSISPGVYEVGNEVVEETLKNIPKADKTLHIYTNGKFHFNLWEANRQILLHCGLENENIIIAGECSFSETEKYFSARRDGAETGRMVSGIMLL
jgi:polyphenol oxidase